MRMQIQLLVKAENPPGPVEVQLYDQDLRLCVRDLSTRGYMLLAAKNISRHLHSLYVNGKSYRIINVIKQAFH